MSGQNAPDGVSHEEVAQSGSECIRVDRAARRCIAHTHKQFPTIARHVTHESVRWFIAVTRTDVCQAYPFSLSAAYSCAGVWKVGFSTVSTRTAKQNEPPSSD